MSLPEARQELLSALKQCGASFSAKDYWAANELKLDKWWGHFQAWERDESFARAFFDNRIAIKELKNKVQVVGGPNSNITFGAAVDYALGAARTPLPSHLYDTGVSGMVNRVKPENFYTKASAPQKKVYGRAAQNLAPVTKEGESLKNKLGLHDMSMSLMNCKKAISAQTFTDLLNPDKDDRYVIFVALAQPEDQAVFYDLNDNAKAVRDTNPAFYAKVRKLRAEITRVKLAWDYDMGSNFIALRPDDKVKPKLRYGMIGGKKLPGVVLPVAANDGDRELAKSQARDYKSILKTQTQKYNEITVAIRKHQNPMFPIFTQWNFETKVFVPFAPEGHVGALHAPIPDMPIQVL